MAAITDKEMKVLLKSQQGEMDAVPMYLALAEVVKDEKDARTFRQLAAEEGHRGYAGLRCCGVGAIASAKRTEGASAAKQDAPETRDRAKRSVRGVRARARKPSIRADDGTRMRISILV